MPRPSTSKQPPKSPSLKKASSKKAASKKASSTQRTTTQAPAPKTKRAAAPKSAAQKSAPVASHDPRAARIAALENAFVALGAKNARRWAERQVKTGSDELGRFVFLRALWLKAARAERFLVDAMHEPESDVARALARLRAAGAPLKDLAIVARAAEAKALKDLCALLDDPSANDDGIAWGLWRMDPKGFPLWQLTGLGDDVDDVDPAND